MPAFNFQPRFAGLVASGRKTQTIRKTRRAKVGDTVYLYTGQRTKQCRKLGEGAVISVTAIRITSRTLITLDEQPINFTRALYMAYSDGFKSTDEMIDWFEKQHGLPFDGWLYRWSLNK